MLAEVRSGKNQGICAAARFRERIGLLDDLGDHRCIGHHFAIDHQGGVGLLHQLHGATHLVAQWVSGAAEVGEGEHGDTGSDVEAPCRLCRAKRNFSEILGGRFDVNGAIGEEVQIPTASHHNI